MRRIDCEACGQRHQGSICDWPAEALDDFRAVGSSAIYKARQVIFNEGGPCVGLYILCHGAVKLYHSDRFGRDHILEVAGAGAVLGELPFSDDQTLSVSAEALIESQIHFLPRERLTQFLRKYPATAVRLVGALSSELAVARRKVRDLALKGAESRLADLLLQIARANGELKAGTRFELHYTRRELGEMIGVSTETAIRLLARLRQKQAIRIHHKEVTITDVQKLSRIANQGEMGG
jgi:CRP/FNR family transcriptional regulator, cyclic AMP receptor protein